MDDYDFVDGFAVLEEVGNDLSLDDPFIDDDVMRGYNSATRSLNRYGETVEDGDFEGLNFE